MRAADVATGSRLMRGERHDDPAEQPPRGADADDAHRGGQAARDAHGDGHGHGDGQAHGHEHGTVDSEVVTNRRALRAVKISALGLGATALLQFAIVAVSGSVALLSDALHNVGDVAGTLTLLVAFTVAQRPSSPTYPYGWRRAEDLGGLVIVLAIAISAGLAGWESARALVGEHTIANTGWAFAAAVAGIVGNEAVAHYKIRVGGEISSPALVADGQHARTDGLASAAAAVGIAGSWIGLPVLDPIAGLGITVAIVWILLDVGRPVLRRLLDAIEPDLVDRLHAVAVGVDGVMDVHDVRARRAGRVLLVQLHLDLPPDLPLRDAHAIAEEVRHALMHHDGQVAAVDVHLDPAGERDEAHRGTAHHQREP
jgi:cation diffusion facilitator family transporter